MKHATSRLLFNYWDKLRGERSAPERSDVEPGAIRHILADTFMLELEGGGPPVFRLAGTRCCALFGRDLKGAELRSLWTVGDSIEVEHYVEICTEEVSGIVLGLVGTSERGDRLAVEMVLLPLRLGGRTNTRLIGAVSPVSVPEWIGLSALGDLETRSLRVLSSTRGNGLVIEDPDERRKRFVVHEGGRAIPLRDEAK